MMAHDLTGRENQPVEQVDAPNPAIARPFQVERRGRRGGDPGR